MTGPFERELLESLMVESVVITPQEGLRLYNDAAEWWSRFQDALADDYEEEDPRRRKSGFKAAWKVFGTRWLDRARELAFYALRFKAAPRGSNKQLRIAVQPITQLRRAPRDVEQWLEKNGKGFLQLLKTRDWPSKDDSDLVFDSNGFTVHNNEGLDDRRLNSIRKLIGASASAIERSRVPKSRGIIYGDIILTSQLTGSRTLAFYRRKQDEVWLSPKTRHGPAEVHTLIHELGHRYWSFSSFLNPDAKAEWKQYDRALRAKSPGSVEFLYPEVGQPIPFKVSGFGRKPPIVQRIEGSSRTGFKFYISEKGFITSRMIFDFYRGEAEIKKFPTRYAATSDSAEEHFCDSFGMYCLGTLEEPHLSQFKEIIL